VVTQLNNKLSRTLKQLLRSLPGDVAKLSEVTLAAGLALADLSVLQAGGMQQAEALLTERAAMISELQAAHNAQVVLGLWARQPAWGRHASSSSSSSSGSGSGRSLSRRRACAGGERGARRTGARPRAGAALQRQVGVGG
jgi:hypothetical protein